METDLCLILPPSRSFNHSRPSLGLMYISAYLEKRGVITHIINIKPPDPVSEPNEEEKSE